MKGRERLGERTVNAVSFFIVVEEHRKKGEGEVTLTEPLMVNAEFNANTYEYMQVMDQKADQTPIAKQAENRSG